MLFSYIKTAFRSIAKNKFYSLLNILGLAVGLIAFIFILIYLRVEGSYDQYNLKHERIFRIESSFMISGKTEDFAIVPVPMAPAMKMDIPEIEAYTRFAFAGNQLLHHKEREYYERDFYFADSSVFDVFTIPMIYGNPKSALTDPHSVVLCQSTSEKYFGKENPVGEVLLSAEGDQYKITGVFEDLPANTHMKFDGLFSIESLVAFAGENDYNSMEPGRFWNIGLYSYLLINENATIETVHEKFSIIYDKYMRDIGEQINSSFILLSTPLADTHFSGHTSSDEPKGNRNYLFIFSAIGLFILIIAAINYMNMATARSVKRAKEVGIRKVSGATKKDLVYQFLSESVVLTMISLIIACVSVYFLFPNFQHLLGKQLDDSELLNIPLLIQVFLSAMIIGLLAGSYPAFYLSSFNPAMVLKGTMSGKSGGSGKLRKLLVVIQFWIAIMMIIGTLIVSSQLKFLQNKDLGFHKENMVVMEFQDSAFRSKAHVFRDELIQHPHVLDATVSSGVPGRNGWIQVVRVEKENQMIDDAMVICIPDVRYAQTYELELLGGRFFKEEMGMDMGEACIVNETAVKVYGWGENAIGKKIIWGADLNGEGGRELKVIGVFKDYHFKSLHNKVQPMVMFLHEEFGRGLLTVKLDGKQNVATLNDIESKWHEMGAKRPFDFEYLESSMNEMYEGEKKTGVIFHIATVITLLIALIGLLGLSSFIAEQKTKEIGIRKVVGASVYSILILLYKEFFWLILIGYLLAIPLTWWVMDSWLNNSFVYTISMPWSAFILAGVSSIMVGIIAVSYHTLKAANGNMVNAVKYE